MAGWGSLILKILRPCARSLRLCLIAAWQRCRSRLREGDRIGVRVGMFNCPGWSQSGGPWMKPEQSMRYLVSAETRVAGGQTFRGVPAKHEKAIQDVALIAYPLPADDGATVRPARRAAW